MKFVTAEQQKQIVENLTSSNGSYWNTHNGGFKSRMNAVGLLKKYDDEGNIKSSYMVAMYAGTFCLNPLFLDDKCETGVYLSTISVGSVLNGCSDEEIQKHNNANWFLGKEHLEVLARF